MTRFLTGLLNKSIHYDNMPMEYSVIFHGWKNGKFQRKNCDIFLIYAQNIDRRYTFELSQ